MLMVDLHSTEGEGLMEEPELNIKLTSEDAKSNEGIKYFLKSALCSLHSVLGLPSSMLCQSGTQGQAAPTLCLAHSSLLSNVHCMVCVAV